MGTPYWYGDPHIGMGRDMSIFQIGESPYRYGAHSNLGTNIFMRRDVDFIYELAENTTRLILDKNLNEESLAAQV